MEILNWSDAPQAAFGREQTQGDAGLFKTLMNACSEYRLVAGAAYHSDLYGSLFKPLLVGNT